ncbi:hypothetical protein MIND_01080300 [Mycena indigotica]|uniref:Uncharacterized protein n=1 Tax=Mycena indigotica TaxID=2126181 RepID=A0A8H6SBR1_9AGAR|nr:uncharacterized protein MIND_01080300 [Mycena indigotica]KAF7295407.1 hypothetical protein MIND_01080300 [Mycena indigotica]
MVLSCVCGETRLSEAALSRHTVNCAAYINMISTLGGGDNQTTAPIGPTLPSRQRRGRGRGQRGVPLDRQAIPLTNPASASQSPPSPVIEANMHIPDIGARELEVEEELVAHQPACETLGLPNAELESPATAPNAIPTTQASSQPPALVLQPPTPAVTATGRPQRTIRLPGRYREELPTNLAPADNLPATAQRQPEPMPQRRVHLIVRDTFRTAVNKFGLWRSYLHRPTYDPDTLLGLDDLCNYFAPANEAGGFPHQPANLPVPPMNRLNTSASLLLDWQNNGHTTKSSAQLDSLVSEVLLHPNAHQRGAHPYWYAQVLGILNATVSRVTATDRTRPVRMEFLWVRWLGDQPGYTSGLREGRLPVMGFVPDTDPYAFGFLDPEHVVRGAHLMPVFRRGRTSELLQTKSTTAARFPNETSDWEAFYVGIFVDRDMVMRYVGGGIGHLDAGHGELTVEDQEDDPNESVEGIAENSDSDDNISGSDSDESRESDYDSDEKMADFNEEEESDSEMEVDSSS